MCLFFFALARIKFLPKRKRETGFQTYRKSLSWEVTSREMSPCCCWLLVAPPRSNRFWWPWWPPWLLWWLWWLCRSELSPDTPCRLANNPGSCNCRVEGVPPVVCWPLLEICKADIRSLPSCWPRDVACKTLCQEREREENKYKHSSSVGKWLWWQASAWGWLSLQLYVYVLFFFCFKEGIELLSIYSSPPLYHLFKIPLLVG